MVKGPRGTGIFISQGLVNKSIDETPSQQDDKLERKVSRKIKDL